MNKHELAEKIAAKISDTNKKQVEDIINIMLELITQELIADGEVTFTGFGSFMPKHRVGRVGVNPQNPGQKINIQPITVPKFKAGKALKDALKAAGARTGETSVASHSVTPPSTPANGNTGSSSSENAGTVGGNNAGM